MAPASPSTRNNGSDDELDDILNGMINGDDPFDTSNIRPQIPQQELQNPANTDANLGLDEEITIEKKRKPQPKLDVPRLISPTGVPRLQRISKERLRFKGKGHEYGDIARMLNMYQFWLDDLFPRAKFADALAIIEGLGHKKHTQIYRRQWIKDSKPKALESDDDMGADEDIPTAAATGEQNAEQMKGLQLENATREDIQEEMPDTTPMTGPDEARVVEDGNPDEDEWDALLAETTASGPVAPAPSASRPAPEDDDPFAAEMEAMAEMEGMW